MPNTQVLTNLESLGDLVGAYIGLAEKADEDEYIERVIKQAHGKAASAFDIATAATAGAGYLSHVYEFGTQGITSGTTRFPDATDPAARLYYHEITGTGGKQEIGWGWRPATQPNPEPTGIASKYMRKVSQKKYLFWNKALVMEEGLTVNIKPKKGNFLFIPFNGKPAKNSSNPRGFTMWDTAKNGAITTKPGASSKGTFTAHWMTWWGQTGQDIMETDMRKSVEGDIELAQAEIDKRMAMAAMKPVQAVKVTSAAASSRSWMKKFFGSRRKVKKVR